MKQKNPQLEDQVVSTDTNPKLDQAVLVDSKNAQIEFLKISGWIVVPAASPNTKEQAQRDARDYLVGIIIDDTDAVNISKINSKIIDADNNFKVQITGIKISNHKLGILYPKFESAQIIAEFEYTEYGAELKFIETENTQLRNLVFGKKALENKAKIETVRKDDRTKVEVFTTGEQATNLPAHIRAPIMPKVVFNEESNLNFNYDGFLKERTPELKIDEKATALANIYSENYNADETLRFFEEEPLAISDAIISFGKKWGLEHKEVCEFADGIPEDISKEILSEYFDKCKEIRNAVIASNDNRSEEQSKVIQQQDENLQLLMYETHKKIFSAYIANHDDICVREKGKHLLSAFEQEEKVEKSIILLTTRIKIATKLLISPKDKENLKHYLSVANQVGSNAPKPLLKPSFLKEAMLIFAGAVIAAVSFAAIPFTKGLSFFGVIGGGAMILDGRKRIQQKQQEFQKQQKQQEQEQKCQEYLPTKMREFKEEINGSNHFYFKI